MNTRTVWARTPGPTHLLEAPGHQLVLLGEAAELCHQEHRVWPRWGVGAGLAADPSGPLGRRPAGQDVGGVDDLQLPPSYAQRSCWKAWVTGRALSLDSNTLLPRMLFPVALFPLPDFPTRMSLSVCGVPSSPRSPGSIKRRWGAEVRAPPSL